MQQSSTGRDSESTTQHSSAVVFKAFRDLKEKKRKNQKSLLPHLSNCRQNVLNSQPKHTSETHLKTCSIVDDKVKISGSIKSCHALLSDVTNSSSSSSNLSALTSSSSDTSWHPSVIACNPQSQSITGYQRTHSDNSQTMPGNTRLESTAATASHNTAKPSFNDNDGEVGEADTSLASTIFGRVAGVTGFGTFDPPQNNPRGSTDYILADVVQAIQPQGKLSPQDLKEVIGKLIVAQYFLDIASYSSSSS